MSAVNLTTGELAHQGSRYPMLAITIQEQMVQDATVQDSYWGQQGYVPWTARSPQAQRAVYRLLDGQEGEWSAPSSPRSPRSPRQISPRGPTSWQPYPSPPSSPAAWPNVRTADAPPPQQGSLHGQGYLTSNRAQLLPPRERVRSPATSAHTCTSLSPRTRQSFSPPASPAAQSQYSLNSPRSPLISRGGDVGTPTGQQRPGSRLGLRLKRTTQVPAGMFFSTGGCLQETGPASTTSGPWLDSPPCTSHGDRAGSRSAGGCSNGRLVVAVDRLAKTAQGSRAAIKQRTRTGRLVDISKSAGGAEPDSMPGTTAGDWDLLLEPNRQRFMQHLDKVTHLMRLSTPPGAFLSPARSESTWPRSHTREAWAESSTTLEFESDVLPTVQEMLQQALESDLSPAAARAVLREHASTSSVPMMKEASTGLQPAGKLLGRSKTFAGQPVASSQQLRKVSSLALDAPHQTGNEHQLAVGISLPPVGPSLAPGAHHSTVGNIGSHVSHIQSAASEGGAAGTERSAGSRLTLQQQVSLRAAAEGTGRTSLRRHDSHTHVQAPMASSLSELEASSSQPRLMDEDSSSQVHAGEDTAPGAATVGLNGHPQVGTATVAQLSVHVIPTSTDQTTPTVPQAHTSHADSIDVGSDKGTHDTVVAGRPDRGARSHQQKPIPVEPSFSLMGAESSASMGDPVADRHSSDDSIAEDDSEASLDNSRSAVPRHNASSQAHGELPQHALGSKRDSSRHSVSHPSTGAEISSSVHVLSRLESGQQAAEATEFSGPDLDPLAQRPNTAVGGSCHSRPQSASQGHAQGMNSQTEGEPGTHLQQTISLGAAARAAWPPVNLDESHLTLSHTDIVQPATLDRSHPTHQLPSTDQMASDQIRSVDSAGRAQPQPYHTSPTGLHAIEEDAVAKGLHAVAEDGYAQVEPQNPVQTSGIPYMVVRSVMAPLPSKEEVEEQQRARELAQLEGDLDTERTSRATQDASRAAKALRRMADGAAAVVGGVAAQHAAPGQTLSMLRTTHAQPHSSRAARTSRKESTPTPTPKKVAHPAAEKQQSVVPVIKPASPDYRHKQGVTDIGTVQMQDIWA